MSRLDRQPQSNQGISRTAFAAKNSFYGLVGKLTSLLLSFVSRTFFIHTLGQYYLGINGLYTDILNMLSFAELGFGSALVFALYGPVDRNEEEKVAQLLEFYKYTYRLIAFAIAVIGITLIPFLQYIVNGPDSLSIFDLRLYFLIFLANTVATYFVSYKYGLLNAMQRTYYQTNLETLTTTCSSCLQIIVLVLTSNFLLYLLANTFTIILSRFLIAAYLNSRFPVLKRKPTSPLPKGDKRKIFHEVKGLAVHQFASVAVYATDSIVISSIPTLGVAVVGAVSNYNLIINSISGLILVVMNSVVAGFGNLAVSSSKFRFLQVFKEANFIDFWIYGVCTICLFVLLPSFITLWAGEQYLIDNASLILILLNFYLQGQSTIYNNARIAKGDFNIDKSSALAQAIVNLVISVICALKFGLVGVYMGTVASRFVLVISRPCLTYRFLFGEKPVWYFYTLVKYLIAVVVAAGICNVICSLILVRLTLATFLAAAVVCFVLSNICFFIFFSKSSEFAAFKTRIVSIIGRSIK